MTQVKQLLGQIASEHLLIPTLESRKSDSLDFHDLSVWALEGALEAAYQAGRDSADPEATDIDAILAARKHIAVSWSVEDMQEIRPDLNEEQAWEVLRQARKRHDATIGINWSVLECHAELLFGDAPETDEA